MPCAVNPRMQIMAISSSFLYRNLLVLFLGRIFRIGRLRVAKNGCKKSKSKTLQILQTTVIKFRYFAIDSLLGISIADSFNSFFSSLQARTQAISQSRQAASKRGFGFLRWMQELQE